VAERVPEHIARDLSAKAARDCGDRLQQTLQLLGNPNDRFLVSLSATAALIGATVGAMQKSQPQRTADDHAAFLMDALLKPMVAGLLAGHSPERIVADAYGEARRG